MKNKEEILSNKIWYQKPNYQKCGEIALLSAEDVRDFIKKLKDRFIEYCRNVGEDYIPCCDCEEIVDKLAGEELSKWE